MYGYDLKTWLWFEKEQQALFISIVLDSLQTPWRKLYMQKIRAGF